MKPVSSIPYQVLYKCSACSQRLYSHWMYCPKCGAPIEWEAVDLTEQLTRTDE